MIGSGSTNFAFSESTIVAIWESFPNFVEKRGRDRRYYKEKVEVFSNFSYLPSLLGVQNKERWYSNLDPLILLNNTSNLNCWLSTQRPILACTPLLPWSITTNVILMVAHILLKIKSREKGRRLWKKLCLGLEAESTHEHTGFCSSGS